MQTTEAGGKSTFTIELSSRPNALVSITLASSSPNEGVVAPAIINFSPDDVMRPQMVTVSGVDDSAADGDVTYAIITSSTISKDAAYSDIDVPDVSVINSDDDVAGIVVAPALTPLTTSESGGETLISVRLATQPKDAVTLTLTSNNKAEGVPKNPLLTFDTHNWNTPQTLFVRGVDDPVVDGPVPYKLRFGKVQSTDPAYHALAVPEIVLSNTDNDFAGVIITPSTSLTTTENGGEVTFSIALATEPLFEVTIPLTSSNPKEGDIKPNFVSFSAENWSRAQWVTIKGVDDLVADGAQVYTIRTLPGQSRDPAYRDFDAQDVMVSNTDNEAQNQGPWVIPAYPTNYR